MPLIILGFIMFVISLLTGSGPVLLISLVNIFSAGGDIAIAIMLLKYRHKNAIILDHPTDCGFIAFI